MAGTTSQRGPETGAVLRARITWIELAALAGWLALAPLLAHLLYPRQNGDVAEYERYARAFWLGHPPFHMLPVEYPPLAILPFTLTLLPPLAAYQTVFVFWMAALAALGYLAFLRFAGRASALAYALYLLLGAAWPLLFRFDIVPGLITLVALWAAERRRFGAAYALLALGILIKLYPLFVVPVVAIEQWHVLTSEAPSGQDSGLAAICRFVTQPATARVVRGLALCLGLALAGYLGALLLNPTTGLSSLTFAAQRPLQIESTPAVLLRLGTFLGFPAHHVATFSSDNYVGSLDILLKPLSALALGAGCLWVYWRQARGRLSLDTAFLACLCVVVAANKIFSPQYLLWVLPVAAAVDGFDPLWLALCLLSVLDFPLIYRLKPAWALTFSWQYLLVLCLRNGLLVFLALRTILAPAARSPGSAAIPRAAEVRVSAAG